MAVAKKRKGAVRKTGSSRAKVKHILAKKQAELAVDPRTKRWARKLHSSRLMYLRNDPDFVAMIKIGRVMNALGYCITNMVTFRDWQTNRTHERQQRRTWVMLGGFLHEAIEVVNSIKGRYLGNADFEPLRALVLDYEHEKTRKKAKKVRNWMAFHLDGNDETTRATISKLKPETFTLWCGENQQNGSYYFELADILDLTYLGEVFPAEDDGYTPMDSGEKVLIDLNDYALAFLTACHTFELMLWEKIREHTY